MLCARVADLMPNERPFSRQELADALMGDEHRAVTQAFMEIYRLAEETVHADTAFERGSASPVRALAIARMKRDEAGIGADLSILEAETED